MNHGYLDLHAIKALEYLVAVAFLILFVPFWKFLNPRVAPAASARPGARAGAAAADRGRRRMVPGPRRDRSHPGHAWARPDGANGVLVGVDDFARTLLGRVSRIEAPDPGRGARAGEPGVDPVRRSWCAPDRRPGRRRGRRDQPQAPRTARGRDRRSLRRGLDPAPARPGDGAAGPATARRRHRARLHGADRPSVPRDICPRTRPGGGGRRRPRPRRGPRPRSRSVGPGGPDFLPFGCFVATVRELTRRRRLPWKPS